MLGHWLLGLIVSGQACFVGIAGLLIAVGIAPLAQRRRGWRMARNLLVGVGGVLVGLSTTPFPLVIWLALGLVSVAWLTLEDRPGRFVRLLRGLMVLAWLGAGLAEIPYHLMPQVGPLGHPPLGIIGDSLTAGTGDGRITTWPVRLAREHGVDVRDHSFPGAKVASALRQAEALQPSERLVILEIGGNDLLGGTSPEAFEVGLSQLLAAVCRPGRLVVLLELPLIPGYAQFGVIQRRLAARSGVILVPKRFLTNVLLAEGSTTDSIHLAPAGHDRLAAAIWRVIAPAYPP